MKKLGLLIFLTVFFSALDASALNYKVHVVYPTGAQDPRWKDTSFDTAQGVRENPVELKQSSFKCYADAFDAGIGSKQFGIQIICRDKEGRTIRSIGNCAEGMKLTPGYNISLSLEESPPANIKTRRWEHLIALECDPGQSTVIEQLSGAMNTKKMHKSKSK